MSVEASIRVGFNARLLHSPDLRGWNRYTVNLLGALVPLRGRAVLYTDRPIASEPPGPVARGMCHGSRLAGAAVSAWEQRWLPRAV